MMNNRNLLLVQELFNRNQFVPFVSENIKLIVMESVRDRAIRRRDELGLNTNQLAKRMGRYQSALRGFLKEDGTKTFRDMVGL